MSVNSNSLGRVYSGDTTRNVVAEFIIINPSGDSDELRYKTYFDAFDAIVDSDPALSKKLDSALRDAGISTSQWATEDDATDRSNYISENANTYLKEFGYRILTTLEWEKK